MTMTMTTTAPSVEWCDLLDPDEETLRSIGADKLHQQALESLLKPMEHGDEPRPRIESHGGYVHGVLLVPVILEDEDRVYYQEVDLVLTPSFVLTVRKTPPDGRPFDLDVLRSASSQGGTAGMLAYQIVDQVAEGYLDMVDGLHDEIDELEEGVDDWPNDKVRRRLSDLRHDVLHIRRTMTPTRDAIRRVIDNRVELEYDELFPHDVELHFADAYDKMLRATEGLDAARDLMAGVRDYHQAKVSNDQNEVMKRLTVVASLLLVPTFIVGLYGQNFDHIPELHWAQGYGFVWVMIVVTTAAQLWYYRRKDWI